MSATDVSDANAVEAVTVRQIGLAALEAGLGSAVAKAPVRARYPSSPANADRPEAALCAASCPYLLSPSSGGLARASCIAMRPNARNAMHPVLLDLQTPGDVLQHTVPQASPLLKLRQREAGATCLDESGVHDAVVLPFERCWAITRRVSGRATGRKDPLLHTLNAARRRRHPVRTTRHLIMMTVVLPRESDPPGRPV